MSLPVNRLTPTARANTDKEKYVLYIKIYLWIQKSQKWGDFGIQKSKIWSTNLYVWWMNGKMDSLLTLWPNLKVKALHECYQCLA